MRQALVQPTVLWLRKLRRRLWRIAHYWPDAGIVAIIRTEWIGRILGDRKLIERGNDSGLTSMLTHFQRIMRSQNVLGIISTDC